MRVKQKALVIFGWEYRWESEFLVALEELFIVQKFYFLPGLRNCPYEKLIAQINSRIKKDAIDVVLFNVDFLNNIDYILIKSISSACKIVFSHDDPSLHMRNTVTCLLGHVHFVIVGDMLSALKYRALGLNSSFLPLEGAKHYRASGGVEQRPIDVLFIGQTEKADRLEMINAIRASGINVVLSGGNQARLSYVEMIEQYQKAKIVLNFSKNDPTENASLEMGLYSYILEFKGRVLEAGLCGALCVSEYAPYADIVFPGREMPVFTSSEQCASVITDLLADLVTLEEKRQAFVRRCEELRPNKIASEWCLDYQVSANTIRRVPDWYLVPSFFDRIRWAVIYRRPADLVAYFKELAAVPIPWFRKCWVVCRVSKKLVLHGLVASIRRIGSDKKQ